MPLPIFPAHLFRPKTVSARVVQRVISGGQALNGEEDVIATDGGGRWRIEFSEIELHTPAQHRAWDAWQSYLQQGAVQCLVPLLTISTAPRPQQWDRPMPVSRLIANDPVFPTTVGYAKPQIEAAVLAAAPLRATTLLIGIAMGSSIAGGEAFSIGERAYRIIMPVAGGHRIEPPLRDAVTAGSAVEFDWPVVRAVSSPGDDFSGSISRGRFGTKQITFVESVA